MSVDPILIGSEFLVNTYLTSDQRFPSIAGLSDGGYIVTWTSFGQDSDLNGVYAQRFDATGAVVGGEFRVNTLVTNNQDYSAVTGLSGGGFVVTWESLLQDGSDDGIYAQMYDAAGVGIGSEFLVNTTTFSYQNRPNVTSLSDGGFVVVWHSLFQDTDSYAVIAQRYDAAGVAQGPETQINTYETSFQWFANVTGLNGGGYVVTWESSGQDANGDGVYGQIYNASGGKVGLEFQISTETVGNQEDNSVIGLTGGGFVVTWESYGQDGSSSGVYAQIFDSVGAQVGIEFLVNTAISGSQYNPGLS